MADAEKIERLAKWMGWNKELYINLEEGVQYLVWSSGELINYNDKKVDDWNPLVNIADAWILLEWAAELRKNSPDLNCKEGFSEKISVLNLHIRLTRTLSASVDMTASETAGCISDIILEAIA